MWEGRELLGTIFVRWRRKHHESASLVVARFVYTASLLLSFCRNLGFVIMAAVVSRRRTYYFGSDLFTYHIDSIMSCVEKISVGVLHLVLLGLFLLSAMLFLANM